MHRTPHTLRIDSNSLLFNGFSERRCHSWAFLQVHAAGHFLAVNTWHWNEYRVCFVHVCPLHNAREYHLGALGSLRLLKPFAVPSSHTTHSTWKPRLLFLIRAQSYDCHEKHRIADFEQWFLVFNKVQLFIRIIFRTLRKIILVLVILEDVKNVSCLVIRGLKQKNHWWMKERPLKIFYVELYQLCW